MNVIVQKYGGSSVANAERIKQVAARIRRYTEKGTRLVAVVSALGDTTDSLIGLSKKIAKSASRREMDMLVSTGEQISTALLAMALHEKGVRAISLTGFQVGITTDSAHTRARIKGIDVERIKKELQRNDAVIVAGFQGMTPDGDITTLGRGGSDLTAVAVAKVLKAKACEIYTDVDGIYTTDPRIVTEARKIDRISYEEMLELASAGAQVMQARSIELAGKFDVPVHVRSSFTAKNGTWIVKGDKKMEEVLVRGVTINKNEAKVTLMDVLDKPGTAANIFRTLATHGINVDMIVQNVSRQNKSYTDISFTVPSDDLEETIKAIADIRPKISRSHVSADRNIAKISVVGIGMRGHSGVAAAMFEVLGHHGVNIDMISTSEIKISCIVKKHQGERAVKLLHRYFLGGPRRGTKKHKSPQVRKTV